MFAIFTILFRVLALPFKNVAFQVVAPFRVLIAATATRPLAGSTSSAASLDKSIFRGELVPLSAKPFRASAPIPRPVHSAHILCISDGLQVSRIDAVTSAAQVVKRESFGDRCFDSLKREAVCPPTLKDSVTKLFAPLPEPAGHGRLGFNLKEKLYCVQDFLGRMAEQWQAGDFLKVHNVLSTKGKRQSKRGAGVVSRWSVIDQMTIALRNYSKLARV